MAKDVTISVGGKNPDGTYSATIGGLDPGNPLLSAPSSTAMVPYQQPGMMAAPFRARVGNVEIMFASEADFLKADRAFREMMGQQGGIPAVGGSVPTLGGGEGGTSGWLRTGAHASEAIGGFLRDRGIRRKLDDLDDATRASDAGMAELDAIERSTPSLAQLIGTLRRIFNAERDATEAAIGALEDELTAVDIQTGAGVAKVAADFMGDNRTIGMGNGTGTAVAVGAAGLGLGLLLSRDSRDRRRR